MTRRHALEPTGKRLEVNGTQESGGTVQGPPGSGRGELPERKAPLWPLSWKAVGVLTGRPRSPPAKPPTCHRAGDAGRPPQHTAVSRSCGCLNKSAQCARKQILSQAGVQKSTLKLSAASRSFWRLGETPFLGPSSSWGGKKNKRKQKKHHFFNVYF